MKALIQKQLHRIYDELTQSAETGVINGNLEDLLVFNLYFVRYIDARDNDELIQNRLQQLAERSLWLEYYSLCGGVGGMHWTLALLHKNGVLDTEDYKLLCNNQEKSLHMARQMLQQNNYDPLHGAIGIAWSLLYQQHPATAALCNDIFDRLDQLIELSAGRDMLPVYFLVTEELDTEKVNLGMAHGITGVLKWCMECYTNSICKQRAQKMAERIIEFLRGHVNDPGSDSYFPALWHADGTHTPFSRMGWCYGDLSTGYILYQAGRLFRDPSLVEFALEVLLHCASRKKPEQTNVKDAGICHGAAGIAHIFLKTWQLTQDARFKQATDFWIRETLALAVYPDVRSGYKKYRGEAEPAQPCETMIEGSAGIGLVLISYLTGDTSWDYLFMLN